MTTKPQEFYMPDYLSFIWMNYSRHNANKRHGVWIYTSCIAFKSAVLKHGR